MEDTEELNIGVNGDTSEFYDADQPATAKKTPPSPDVDHLLQRIGDLERENSESEKRIGELKAEIESMKKEKDAASESDRKAIQSVAKRAAELEIDVVRLHEDLIMATGNCQEFEGKVKELEERESKVMKEKEEKESEISELKREKKAVEGSVTELQALLKESEEKVKEMKERMNDLVKEAEESGEIIERFANRGSMKGLNLQVVGAFSAAAVVAMAVIYAKCSRNR